MPRVTLDAGDAVELAELLQFLRNWLAHDHDCLNTSLRAFVDAPGYELDQLGTDLDRFGFLLGGNNSALFLQIDQ
jgi:hypothetical protein